MNNAHEPKKLYATSNLFLAAFLDCSEEVELNSVDYSDLHNSLLLFSPAKRCQELAEDYQGYKELPVRAVFRAYDRLRKIVKSKEQPRKDGYYR